MRRWKRRRINSPVLNLVPKMRNRKQAFRQLCQQAAACTVCPRMTQQKAVLSAANGSLSAKILFASEAPGRFGSGRTGIPFHGDRSGDHFEELIAHIGLTRQDIFITNAVLCNPLHEGNNSRPTSAEIKNCSGYFKSVLDLVRPKIVVTLGAVGLTAVNSLCGTRYQLSDSVARPITLEDFILLPLYHPSPRVTNWKRSLTQQKKDFQGILKLLASID